MTCCRIVLLPSYSSEQKATNPICGKSNKYKWVNGRTEQEIIAREKKPSINTVHSFKLICRGSLLPLCQCKLGHTGRFPSECIWLVSSFESALFVVVSLHRLQQTPFLMGFQKARRKCVSILNNEMVVEALTFCKRVNYDSPCKMKTNLFLFSLLKYSCKRCEIIEDVEPELFRGCL